MSDRQVGGPSNQVARYLEIGRRLLPRWWVVLLASVVGTVASVVLALALTRVYQSRALITWRDSVNQSRIFTPDEVGRPEMNWLESRVALLLSSHTLLWKLASEYDLYPRDRRALPPEVILERMRDAIKFETVGPNTFWIAFEYRDAYWAQQVTARLVREFIDQNVGERVSAALATAAFMDEEVTRVKAQLGRIENDIAQFVSEHPEFETDPATGLLRGRPFADSRSTMQPRVRADTPELKRALRERGRLEALLRLLANPASDTTLQQARQDLALARKALAAKRQKYTDQHPDVQRARLYLEESETQYRTLMAARGASSSTAAHYRDQLATLDQTISRLAAAQQKGRDEARGASSQRAPQRLTQAAELEKRWYQLTRDRAIEKAKYDQVQERQLKAKVAANLEKQQAMNRFEIVDPAHLPQKPIRPNRTRLVVVGTALGGLIGLGLAILLVILDPRIHNEEDVRRACDLPLLAQIPPHT